VGALGAHENKINNVKPFAEWLCSSMPRLPLIGDLTLAPIPPGSNILVEFDPASQWYNASLTIAAGWLRSGGNVSYITHSRSPDDIRSQLGILGLATEQLERNDRLWITDLYTPSLGQKSKEKFAPESLKVNDLSIWIAREAMVESASPEFLVVAENNSVLDRFNDEKNWVELFLTRPIPVAKSRQITQLIGFISGVHSAWAYKQLEATVDRIVDFKVEEEGEETRDLMRIRTLRKVGFDRKWHALKTSENSEVTLQR
jgi:KaiC/GvpD/RAD55 family RecA-like ATPase